MIRYEWHDILRALLATLIVLQHVRWLNDGTEFWWGRAQLAVNTFIVLLGFWAAMSLQKPQPYWQWIGRKLWRLWPAFAICLFLALAMRPLVLGTDPPEASREAAENQHFIALLAVQVPMLQGLVPEAWLPYASRAFLPSGWFVSLAVQCYFAAPLLCRLSEAWLWRVFGLSLAALLHPIGWRMFELWPLGSFLPQKLYLLTGGILLYRYAPRIGSGQAPGFLAPAKWMGKESYVIYLAHYPILQTFFL
jgi:peptidoglycan/LPS O-acetylase OafA/YrhL